MKIAVTLPSSVAVIVIVLLTLLTPLDGYKILLIPMPAASHIVLFSSAAEALVKAGHEAHVVKPRSAAVPSQYENSGIHYVNHGEEGHVHFTVRKNFTKLVGRFSQMSMREMAQIYTWGTSLMCQDFLENEELYKELERNKYDFVIVDSIPWVSGDCMFAVPHRLGVPYGVLSILHPLDMIGATLQINYLTTSIPLFYSKEPSFLMRFAQFFAIQALLYGLKANVDEKMIHDYIRERPVQTIHDLTRNSKIWLIDNEPLVTEPKHLAPNMIMVGGLSAAPSKPLPKDLQKFADSAKDGLVVVSFGGSLTTDFPEEILKKLLQGLSSIRHHVIIRLKTKPSCDIGKNILITKWLPQNDLLGHKNTVLFVTHCGISSVNEAVYHGVPMLGFPNKNEQHANAVRFSDKNYGLFMDRNNFTDEELKTNVEKMMRDSTWRDAVKKASRIIKSRRFSAGEEAAYWIDHVIKYGADHLTPSTNQLAWYQVMMYDIMAAILVIVLILAFVIIKCCQCCKRVCYGKAIKQKQS